MRGEIRRIQQTLNMTTIHVTHDQEEAMSIADKIVVMNCGVIEQIGSPREVYEEPATPFVAEFLGRVNLLKGQVTREGLLLLGKCYPLPSRQWASNTELVCFVRPERVTMKKEDPSLIPATVTDATYTGSLVHYDVIAKAGEDSTELAVELPSPEAVYKPGEEVGIDLEIADMRLFRSWSQASDRSSSPE
jgi:iron(III) transport system ATP-binding protein